MKTKSLEDTFLRAFLFVKLYNRGKKSCEVLAMFHKEKPDYHRCQYGFYTIDELVPEDHFLRQLESEVDFDFMILSIILCKHSCCQTLATEYIPPNDLQNRSKTGPISGPSFELNISSQMRSESAKIEQVSR